MRPHNLKELILIIVVGAVLVWLIFLTGCTVYSKTYACAGYCGGYRSVYPVYDDYEYVYGYNRSYTVDFYLWKVYPGRGR